MAANNGGGAVPDMESLLAALAAVTKQEQERQRREREEKLKAAAEATEEDEYDPSKLYDQDPIIPQSRSRSAVPYDPFKAGQTSEESNNFTLSTNQEPKNDSAIDPASITEWRTALRCVNTLAAQNPNFKNVIYRMITDQDKHEKIWYEGRQAIFKKGRVSLFQNLPEPLKEEVRTYDKKVYKACEAMNKSMTAELKLLGVPFFGVNPDILLPGGADEIDEKRRASGSHPKAQKITKNELLELQRKMIQYLEDLYRD